MAPGPPRDWIQIFVTALPGLAAVIALIFTWLSINATTNATNRQLEIAEQGQVTDRYNAAVTNLDSSSVDVRLGGIYALQRIMQDSPRDQPTVVAVLCAFVRDHANAATANSANPSAAQRTSPARGHPPTDIQAALTVVVIRNTTHDSSTTIVDLSGANLSGAALFDAKLTLASLSGADLSGANLSGANLSGADLTGADLTGAFLDGTDLSAAFLDSANLTRAGLKQANLTDAGIVGANLTRADLYEANLTGAALTGANLTRADLFEANFTDALLFNANLTGADVSDADLSGADLSGAKGLQTGTPRSTAGSTPAP